VIASYLQSGSREWHPSGRPRRTNNLLLFNKNPKTAGMCLKQLIQISLYYKVVASQLDPVSL